MPISLREYGLQQSLIHQKRERQLIGNKGTIGGDTKVALDGLNDNLNVFALRLARLIYVNGKIKNMEWLSIRRNELFTRLPNVLKRFTRSTATLANRYQKEAFTQVDRDLTGVMSSIYPITSKKNISKRKYEETVDALVWMDSDIEFEFIKGGKEITESEYLQLMVDMSVEAQTLSKVIVFEQQVNSRGIRLLLGTGNLTDDFAMFLERQLEVGLLPADFITTISSELIPHLQRTLMDAIKDGKDLAWTRDKFVSEVMHNFTSGAARQKFSNDIVRILRTAHGRAAASANSLFGLRNRDLVSKLQRIANGRPCCNPVTLIKTKRNHKCIKNVKVGDQVFNGLGQLTTVMQMHKNLYEGAMYTIEVEEGRKLEVTPNHKIYIWKDSIKGGDIIRVLAEELKENMEIVTIEDLYCDTGKVISLRCLDKHVIKNMLQEKSEVDNKTNCWLWQGSLKGSDKAHMYGTVWLLGGRKDSKEITTHRLSAYAYLNFNINNSSLCVCHKCDVPHCVNPEHLFIGTHFDNMMDMVKKGRAFKGLKGELNPMCNPKVKEKNRQANLQRWREGNRNNNQGIANGRSKLNDHIVRQGRQLFKQGLPFVDIYEQLKPAVPFTYFKAIVEKRNNWKHVKV